MRTRFARIFGFVMLAFVMAPPALAAPGATEKLEYGSVMLHRLGVQYTEAFLTTDPQRDHRVEGLDLDKIRRYYERAVTANLAAGFPIASKPGPGVLRVDAILIDHVLDKRDWLVPSKARFRTAPKVHLVAFLRDSQTGEILDRVGLTLNPHANRLMLVGPSDYWNFMRSVFDRVATRVRWAMEDGVSPS